MKLIVSLYILLFSTLTFASVWETQPGAQWSDQWETQYIHWIATEVEGTFFKDLGKPYSSIPLDCADAHYALRAYFAMKNGLPFAANGGDMTHNSSRFDHIKNKDKRMAAFITFLRDSYWTETLTSNDTYPPAISDLKPGDLFMYKVSSNGNYTRHTYIIKNINPDGTFDILYSTQANAAAGGALKRKKSFMFKKAPRNTGSDYQRWGFRRMKRPQHIGTSQSKVPGANFEQYDLASQLSSQKFFAHVKKTNQTISESPQMVTQRNFNNICATLNDRVDIVKKAISFQNQIGGRCMRFQEYDAHSTPSRDSGIMDEYDAYAFDYQTILDDGESHKVQQDLKEITELIFSDNLSDDEKEEILESCPIEFGKNNQGNKLLTDLGTFREALFSGKVSYHPNDNLYRRWGVSHGSKTSCKEFYGYPTN